MLDTPYGDHFSVRSHWLLRAEAEGCALHVSLEVHFHRSTFLKASGRQTSGDEVVVMI